MGVQNPGIVPGVCLPPGNGMGSSSEDPKNVEVVKRALELGVRDWVPILTPLALCDTEPLTSCIKQR